jgi:hypothetical protein
VSRRGRRCTRWRTCYPGWRGRGPSCRLMRDGCGLAFLPPFV